MNTLIGSIFENIGDSNNTGESSIMDFILKLLPKLGNFNTLENKQREKLELIKIYLQKNPDFFSRFIKENTELLSGNYIESKLENYERNFLKILDPTLNDSYLNYEMVVDSNLNILYNEGLFRTNAKNIKYFEILDIYTKLGHSVEIAYRVLDILINDIKSGHINTAASINVEVSDFINPYFIDEFERLIKENELEIKDNMIIFEILENQPINDTNKFRESLERINNMGISIAIDDTMQIGSYLEDINEIRKILETHSGIKIVKICGKYLQKLYEEFNKGTIKHDKLQEIQSFVSEIKNKGFNVVGEWIEDKEHLYFAKNILGVSHFQGFYFNKQN